MLARRKCAWHCFCSPAQTYDPTFPDPDDAIMLVDVADFEPDGNCDTGSYPVELRFTEQ